MDPSNFWEYQTKKTCWGNDEYHALVTFLSKFTKEMKLLSEYLVLRTSSLRPTGREEKYIGKIPPPFFETTSRPFIKGLITRFMVRFLVSETEEELKTNGEEFADYLKRYGAEFPEDIVLKMRYTYKEQLDKIRDKQLNEKKANLKDSKKEALIEDNILKATEFLRKYGYRVQIKNNTYKVTEPLYYQWPRKDNEPESLSLSPIELILYWENKSPKFTGNSTSMLGFIGSGSDDEMARYVNILESRNITPFVISNKENTRHLLFVFKEEKNIAQILISEINADLCE